MKYTCFLLLLWWGSFQAQAHFINDSARVHHMIVSAVQQAPFIFEGEVVSAESYWDSTQQLILTGYQVALFQTWKTTETNDLSSENGIVEVILVGGTVGNLSTEVIHGPKLQLGAKGMFFSQPASLPSNPQSSVPATNHLELYDGLFLPYDYSKGYASAGYGDIHYGCLDILYEVIDTNYVGDNCIEYIPNGVLQTHTAAQIQQVIDVRAATVSSGAEIARFSLENPKQTSDGSKRYFEFDIYMSLQNPAQSYYLMNASPNITFNTQTFGQNLVQNNRITVERGEIIASVTDYYPPVPVEIGHPNHNDAVRIVISSYSNASFLFELTNTPKQLAHVKIEIDDCQSPSVVNLAKKAVPGYNCANLPSAPYDVLNPNYLYCTAMRSVWLSPTVHQGPSIEVISDYVIPPDKGTLTEPSCEVSITGISPEHVGAGVGDLVTLQGHNFGNTVGTIHLRNADVDVDPWLMLDNVIDQVNWSENTISFVVPSLLSFADDLMGNSNTPGTGKVRVETSSGKVAYSDQFLYIDYSRKNVAVHNPDEKIPVHLIGNDAIQNLATPPMAVQGYRFQFNSNVTVPIRNCLLQAMKDWTCLTGVSWNMDSAALPQAASHNYLDGINLISIVSLPSRALAQTTIHRRKCVTATTATGVAYEVDIAINADRLHELFFDHTGLQNVPANLYDFYEVALHEMGHAHLLNHVIDPHDLMNTFSSPPGTAPAGKPAQDRLTYFSPSNQHLANEIMADALQINPTNCTYVSSTMSNSTIPLCQVVINGQNERVRPTSGIRVYPNPAETAIFIAANGTSGTMDLLLYDAMGRLLRSETRYVSAGEQSFDLQGLADGLYLLETSVAGTRTVTKVIKKTP